MKYLCIILLTLISCKQENRKDQIKTSNLEKNEKNFLFKVKFSDTVMVNEKNDGEIIYNSPFDTIVDNFSDPKRNRYVVFRTLPNDAYSFLNEQFNDSLKEYRIGAIDNRTIPFYDLSFNKTGTYKIQGVVNDQILIEPNTKLNPNKNGIRWIEKDFPVSFKIIVIDSTFQK